MNYYERHLGDYARDTAHLTMLEHGAYTLLLDRYYATESPIPADQAHRRCGEPGLSECGEGPCSLCGWNFDDGIPDQYEQSELYEDHEKETLEISVGILPDMPDGAGKAQLGLDGRNEAKAEGEG